MFSRIVCVILAVVLAFAAAPVFAGPQVWTSNGPSEQVLAVALNPNDENALLASGASGVWQTSDGGGSWTKVSSTLLGESLAYNPLDPAVAYANSKDHKQVFKSTDGGATWTSVFSLPSAGQVLSVLPDPMQAGRVFASGSGSDDLAMVQRSLDSGATWSNVLPASLNGAGGLSTPVATPLAARQGSALIVAGVTYYHSGGVVGSTDGGGTWNLLYNDSFTPLAGASALSAGNSLYAGLNVLEFGSLVRSDNDGASWVDLSPQLPITGTNGGFVQAIATDASAPATVYIAEWDTATPPRTGVFGSSNRGVSWTELGHLEPRVSGPDGLVWAVASQTLHAATESGVYEYTFGTPPPSK
ncbi:MAG: hypothetical protein JOZ65_24255 [Chloroflexi bacterium]|nr:hypothetical protein [Chloroflexota bacterium]